MWQTIFAQYMSNRFCTLKTTVVSINKNYSGNKHKFKLSFNLRTYVINSKDERVQSGKRIHA